jgi:hypothetical protein
VQQHDRAALPSFVRCAPHRARTRADAAAPGLVALACGASAPIASSCFQLLLLYAVVYSLQSFRQLPASTSQVAVQLLVHLLLPSWLFVTTATAVSTIHSMGIALQAAGAAAGAAAVILGSNHLATAAAAVLEGRVAWASRLLASLPWQRPSPAAVIASTAAAAFGNPAAAPALMAPAALGPDQDTTLLRLACVSSRAAACLAAPRAAPAHQLAARRCAAPAGGVAAASAPCQLLPAGGGGGGGARGRPERARAPLPQASFDPSQCLLASLLLNQSLWQLPHYAALCQLLASISSLWLWGFAQHFCTRGLPVPSAWAALVAWLSSSGSSGGSGSSGSSNGSSSGSCSSGAGAYSSALDRPEPGAAASRVGGGASAPLLLAALLRAPLCGPSACSCGLAGSTAGARGQRRGRGSGAAVCWRWPAGAAACMGAPGPGGDGPGRASLQQSARAEPLARRPQVDGVLMVISSSGPISSSSSGIYGREAALGERLEQLLDSLHAAAVAPVQAVWGALSGRLSPPALGALLGAAAGLALCCRPAWLEPAPGSPWEMGLLLGGGAAAWQLAAALGGAAVVMQQLLLVLPLAATSLAGQSRGDQGGEAGVGDEEELLPAGGATIDVEQTDGAAGVHQQQQQQQQQQRRQQRRVRLRSVWSPDALAPLLLPQGAAERQCLGAAAGIRFILLPGLALGAALLLAGLGVSGLCDSVPLKACMMLPVMPPAASMVVLLMQREGADLFTAARAARLVLQMQLLAVLAAPAWLWVLGRVRWLLL